MERGAVGMPMTVDAGTEALCVSVSVDEPDIAVVTVSGRLIRQHAAGLDGSLASVFAHDHPIFVIDLAGVTSLDPTTLATITRRAALARRRGALITIVPPGAGRARAA
jgi:anti-anti-sigma regulatory factor